MSFHTLGSFEFDEEQGEVVMSVDGEKVRVRIPYARRTGSVVYGSASLGAEMQANGRLCAGAPDLLAALKGYVERHEVCRDRSCPACAATLLAIAKAEGKS